MEVELDQFIGQFCNQFLFVELQDLNLLVQTLLSLQEMYNPILTQGPLLAVQHHIHHQHTINQNFTLLSLVEMMQHCSNHLVEE